MNIKRHIFIVMLFTISIVASGQNVGYNYDADGNMEFRYIITLKSSKNIDKEITAIDSIIVDLPARHIRIYPNPTQDRISIDIMPLNMDDDNHFRLYDMSGKLLLSQKITSSPMEIEITGAQGIYLLDIHLGKEVSKWKIIKQ